MRPPLLLLTFAALAAEAAPKLDFNRDIRPILSDNCFACHGFDAKKRKADLRLDTPEGATAINDGVQAIKPGDPEGSELIKRLLTKDPEEVMPPPESHKKLTQAQIDTLRRWIAEGAPYRKHWSFEPPVRPPVPAAAAGTSPIDAFLRAELSAQGLQPAPEADKARLLRRVTLDLTGLPPTPAEVDAFLADRSPDAYENLVDRLLASPHYGEHMARGWLDLARYADSNGYQVDLARSIWPYRQWVIDAFNRNQPFDQFTIDQLAGDLLPQPTLAQRIATGFNRNTKVNDEGGGDAEEYRTKAVKDRVATVGTAWLGLTLNCAECHTHKYDPITHEEYYRFYAFFNNSTDSGNYSLGPSVEVPKPANWDRMDDIERRLWLRENGQAPVPAPRAEGGERRGREDRGRDDRGRDSGNRRGGRGRRH